MNTDKKLFLVVLGGRYKGCHIEQHDVRWVVGETIEATTQRTSCCSIWQPL